MICKVCGTNNPDYLEYCEKCAAPLRGDDGASRTDGQEPAHSRGFVRSPVWAKPDFDANTISAGDIPADFQNLPKQAAQPAAPAGAAPQQKARPASGKICPKCGARLIEGQRFCNSCGAKVEAASLNVQPIVSAAAGASAWAGASARQTSASNMKFADPIDDTMFSYDYTGSKHDARTSRGRQQRPAAPAQKSNKRPSGSAPRRPAHPRKRGGVNGKLIGLIAGGVVLLALIVFGAVKLINGGLFNSSAITKEAVIEPSTTRTGEKAYNITVYAKKGSVVRFEGGSLVKEQPVEGRKPVTFGVPELLWVPDHPVNPDELTADGCLAVTPQITVVSKKGDEEQVSFPEPILIPIPTIDMTVTSPNTEQFMATSPAVEISGIVGDTTATVYVNDEQVPADETGTFVYTYTLTEPGTTELTIEARKNGYAIARKVFNVEFTGTAPQGGTAPAGGTAAPAEAKSIYYANTDDVNVRDVAGTNGNAVGKLGIGDKVFVVSADSNDWYKIIYNGSEAYVAGSYIKKICDVTSYTTTTASIKGDDINIRSAPSADGKAVAQLANGTEVAFVQDAGNGWSMIEYNGKILFVSTQYLKK